jgi:hypothetical protein
MASFDERLRRLEERMARLDVPSLDEARTAFQRTTERALVRFRGEGEPYEDRRERDRDTIRRWAEGEGVDLASRAEKARQKLRNMDRARE